MEITLSNDNYEVYTNFGDFPVSFSVKKNSSPTSVANVKIPSLNLILNLELRDRMIIYRSLSDMEKNINSVPEYQKMIGNKRKILRIVLSYYSDSFYPPSDRVGCFVYIKIEGSEKEYEYHTFFHYPKEGGGDTLLYCGEYTFSTFDTFIAVNPVYSTDKKKIFLELETEFPILTYDIDPLGTVGFLLLDGDEAFLIHSYSVSRKRGLEFFEKVKPKYWKTLKKLQNLIVSTPEVDCFDAFPISNRILCYVSYFYLSDVTRMIFFDLEREKQIFSCDINKSYHFGEIVLSPRDKLTISKVLLLQDRYILSSFCRRRCYSSFVVSRILRK